MDHFDVQWEAQRAPAEEEERRRIRRRVESISETETMSRQRLREWAESIVDDTSHLAWTMVLIGSRLWRDRVQGVPFDRRILLLPHCMRSVERCPARYDREGLLCEQCGACPLGSLKKEAERLGYYVMIAEGSPIVMQWILGGKADAILGVGCLRSLERAFDQLQLAGIPAMAVPLHASNCRDSQTDLDWVFEMIRTPFEPEIRTETSGDAAPGRLHLLRGAAKLFDRERNTVTSDDPIDQTSKLAMEFLTRGGKFYRPFITLATFDALTGSRCTGPDGAEQVERLPGWVGDAAKAIEIFHKASLIHDDIEDDDAFRYGLPTLHTVHGTATAINVGDYLIGLGYESISDLGRSMKAAPGIVPGEIVSEILVRLSRAHVRLSRGQGAELAWKSRRDRAPALRDILEIYVLKTSPAFEAALDVGVLSALAVGAVGWDFYRSTREILARFSRHLGVAFQIRNDLDDWLPDRMNKHSIGADVVHGRPTLLRALSGEDFVHEGVPVGEVYERFQKAGVFEKARRLIEKHADRAKETAESLEHESFRRLLFHFVETIAAS